MPMVNELHPQDTGPAFFARTCDRIAPTGSALRSSSTAGEKTQLTGSSCPIRLEWGWQSKACLLLVALRTPGAGAGLAESTDQPHLIAALHRVYVAWRRCPAPGPSTGWPSSATPPPSGSPPRSPRWRTTTGVGGVCPSRRATARRGEKQPLRGAALVADPGRRLTRAGADLAHRSCQPRGYTRLWPTVRTPRGHRSLERERLVAAPAPFPAISASSEPSQLQRWSRSRQRLVGDITYLAPAKVWLPVSGHSDRSGHPDGDRSPPPAGDRRDTCARQTWSPTRSRWPLTGATPHRRQ